MRHSRIIVLLSCLMLFFTISGVTLAQDPVTTEEAADTSSSQSPVQSVKPETTAAVEPAETPELTVAGGDTTYVVQRGDNLFRIALRFGLTTSALASANGIVNPSLIYSGQVLKIPGPATPTAVPPTTPVPTQAPPTTTNTYVVVPGDTLLRIAIRFSTTAAVLQQLNNIPNPNLIYVGQSLNIPAEGSGSTSTTTTSTTTTTSITTTSLPDAGFDYGIELFPVGQDITVLATQATGLGVSWVKVTLLWRDLEPAQGQIDFTSLDPVVSTLKSSNMNILFTVTTAPTWARTSVDENGPPDDFANFATFVGALASRYKGQVNAYEIWNEPNLRREWNSTTYPIRADHYVSLLNAAYQAIKTADPDAQVISAGLAPTGYNDGINAINDRVFLQDMYSNKVGDFSDAIGAHSGGWANPPDSSCCTQPEGVATHFNDRSFYFKDTLTDYRQIMTRNNDSGTAIWVTKFGWGSSEDGTTPGQSNVFLTYTSLTEQATYDSRGFQVGEELGFVGPMFLYNLNGCQSPFDQAEACYYALNNASGGARPAFNEVAGLDKTTAASNESTVTQPEATEEAPTVTEEPLVALTPEATASS